MPHRITPERIAQVLQKRGEALPEPACYPNAFFRRPPMPASVLMPLYREQGEWHLLFIRRSEFEHDRHSGQVAFPGGKVEEEDADATEAALREAEEEIGLDPGHVSVLGYLRDYRTISNYLVTPVVAQIDWPVDLVLDEREVSRVFSIPLRWLCDENNYRIGQRNLEQWDKQIEVIHFERYDGELLWGITAKLTLSLLHLLELVPRSGLDCPSTTPQE